MTGAEIMAAAGFIVMLLVQAFAVWKYVSGEMKSLRLEAATKADGAAALASMARSELAAYQTRVAETFATKAGMQEQTAQLLRAIESIGGRIDGLGERLDNIMLHQQKPAARRSS